MEESDQYYYGLFFMQSSSENSFTAFGTDHILHKFRDTEPPY